MKPKWLIEKDTYDDGNVEKMVERCKRSGTECVVFEFPNFGGDVSNVKWPFDPAKEDIVIAYGTINLAQYINRHCKWLPGVWCDFANLTCSVYMTHWGKYSIQKEYAFYPLNEIPRLKERLFEKFQDETGHIFVRPDSNDKIFHGEKVHLSLFDKWWRVSNTYGPYPHQLTMVSRPSPIDFEWRFVVANRKVVTGSRYVRQDGKVQYKEISSEDNEAKQFAETVANSTEWQPAPIYTLDICKSLDSHYLMEIGSVNTSGLYKCNIEAIMQIAEEIAISEWKSLDL